MDKTAFDILPAHHGGSGHALWSASALVWLMLALLGSLFLSSRAGAQVPEGGLTLELVERVEQLEREVRYLRGELELYRHQLEGLQHQRASAQSQPDGAAAPALETAPATPVAETAPAAESVTVTNPTPPVAAEADRAAFDKASRALRTGDYAAAIAGFNGFISAHPDSPLAGDAQYWLGEAYYARQNYQAAKEAFINLGLNHPQNTYLADALLKLGDSYGQLGDVGRAKEVLQKLIASYPDSPAAAQAMQRLSVLP